MTGVDVIADKFNSLLEEKVVLVGRPDRVGGTGPISFDDMLALPQIILRQGLNARAVMDEPSLLKRFEENAQFQMNSIAAIGGSLLSGIGCLIGTEFILQDHLDSGELVACPIVKPTLNRTLYIGEMNDRAPTFALEAIRTLCVELMVDAIQSERWKATQVIRVYRIPAKSATHST